MYPNNPNDIVANFIVYQLDNGWELYLHKDINNFDRFEERCLAVTETIAQMLGFIENKMDGLQGQDILISYSNNNINNNNIIDLWIIPQLDGSLALFQNTTKGRIFLDEDMDIDSLISRNNGKNILISF